MLPNYDAAAIARLMGVAPGSLLPAATAGGVARAAAVHDDFTPFDIPAAGSRYGAGLAERASPPPSPVAIERAVESGLPRQALRRVAEAIAGGDNAQVAALEWSVVPKTTLDRRHTRLSPQESERTERLARLFVHATRALGTEAEARAFMTAPHPELDGRTPVEAAKTDLGTRRVEHILNALEYGLAL